MAVEVENHSRADIKHVDDLSKKFLKELEEFFVNYHQLTGNEYRILDVKGQVERENVQKLRRTAKRADICYSSMPSTVTHRTTVPSAFFFVASSV
jgi:inorganic pyrophosphatase